jgi:hypothetical protein
LAAVALVGVDGEAGLTLIEAGWFFDKVTATGCFEISVSKAIVIGKVVRIVTNKNTEITGPRRIGYFILFMPLKLFIAFSFPE